MKPTAAQKLNWTSWLAFEHGAVCTTFAYHSIDDLLAFLDRELSAVAT